MLTLAAEIMRICSTSTSRDPTGAGNNSRSAARRSIRSTKCSSPGAQVVEAFVRVVGDEDPAIVHRGDSIKIDDHVAVALLDQIA
jgi:hypothetical protein